jgi:shikimate kinase
MRTASADRSPASVTDPSGLWGYPGGRFLLSMQSLILVGMMGSGKSTIGRTIADLAEVPFHDLDRVIARNLGHSVPWLFERLGEQTFRDHEANELRQLPDEACVIATGGGVVLREDNWTEMRRRGKVVWLRASLEVLAPRLERGRMRRPLLAHDDWQDRVKAILDARTPLYSQADCIVDVTEAEPEQVAKHVMEACAWPSP